MWDALPQRLERSRKRFTIPYLPNSTEYYQWHFPLNESVLFSVILVKLRYQCLFLFVVVVLFSFLSSFLSFPFLPRFECLLLSLSPLLFSVSFPSLPTPLFFLSLSHTHSHTHSHSHSQFILSKIVFCSMNGELLFLHSSPETLNEPLFLPVYFGFSVFFRPPLSLLFTASSPSSSPSPLSLSLPPLSSLGPPVHYAAGCAAGEKEGIPFHLEGTHPTHLRTRSFLSSVEFPLRSLLQTTKPPPLPLLSPHFLIPPHTLLYIFILSTAFKGAARTHTHNYSHTYPCIHPYVYTNMCTCGESQPANESVP